MIESSLYCATYSIILPKNLTGVIIVFCHIVQMPNMKYVTAVQAILLIVADIELTFFLSTSAVIFGCWKGEAGGLWIYNNINLLYVLRNLISPANKPFKLEIQYRIL